MLKYIYVPEKLLLVRIDTHKQINLKSLIIQREMYKHGRFLTQVQKFSYTVVTMVLTCSKSVSYAHPYSNMIS